MAKKKGKTPKNEPKTLSCPCDHPFQCNCGNRPERPSRGHKWDTPTQTWTGKGHKQKGAGTTKSSTDAVVSRSGGATIEQWQKLPSQILGDICKKEGRPVLKFISQREGHGSGMRCKCIVGHPKKKGREHELVFIPSHYVRNEEQAREESALLALLTLTPRLPHERKFPEPYRTTWLNAQASSSSQPNPQNAKKPSSAPSAAAQTNSNKPAPASASVTNGSKATPQTTTSTNRPTNANAPSNHNHNQTNNQTNHNNTHTNHYSKAMASNTLQASSKYVSLAEKNRLAELKRQERNSKTHAREAKKMANRDHEVFMSAPLRKRIEDLLRQGQGSMDIDDEEAELEGMEAVVQMELLELGFDTVQVRRAIRAQTQNTATATTMDGTEWNEEERQQLHEQSLQWLCIHLDEAELPAGFDPRGRTLDVIGGKANSNTANGKRTNVLKRFGLAPHESTAVVSYLQQQQATEILTLEQLQHGLHTLILSAIQTETDSTPVNIPQQLTTRNAEEENDEMETLLAIFPPEEIAITKSDQANDASPVKLISIQLHSEHEELTGDEILTSPTLLVDMSLTTQPMVLITGTWKRPLGATVQVKLARLLTDMLAMNIANEEPNAPIVYELYGHAKSLLEDMAANTTTENEGKALLSVLQAKQNHGTTNGTATKLMPQSNQDDERTTTTTASATTEATTANNSRMEDLSSMSISTHNTNSNHNNNRNHNNNNNNNNNHNRNPKQHKRTSPFWSVSPQQTPQPHHPARVDDAMIRQRSRLPAAKAKEQFLEILQQSDKTGGVVLVTGETGCGKTTQIPQFILESLPTQSKIVVTQPRRLAATGVATRVAAERGESFTQNRNNNNQNNSQNNNNSNTVGYMVRGESRVSNTTRLLFCTTGVLLRRLQDSNTNSDTNAHDPLSAITHIVIDEVHERSLDTDILLGILKQTVKRIRQQQRRGDKHVRKHNIRVILMSATMDADRFAGYFGKRTPRMHIPGFTYPVTDYTLEDVLSVTGYIPPKKLKNGKSRGRYYGGPRKRNAWNDSEKSDEEEEEEEEEVEEPGDGEKVPRGHGIPIEDLVKRVSGHEIDYDMLGVLIRHLLQNREPNDDGSILVFLPGAPEISRAETSLRKILSSTSCRSLILPLHGGLQPRDQAQIFSSPPRYTTKIILSTNIAETSLTIPDCTIVIDTCREKQSGFDPRNRMPTLVEHFCSQDSCRQRRGRAGRVRSGVCYKLISKRCHDSVLREHGQPEIHRCALDSTMLGMLCTLQEKQREFWGELMDPPSREAVEAAVISLTNLGAVRAKGKDGDLELTPLGRHLAGIPAPPCVGKLLVMGSLLGCRSATLAIAGGMSIPKSIFLRNDTRSFPNRNSRPNHHDNEPEDDGPSNEELRQASILQERNALLEIVGNSDHAMLASAYLTWDQMQDHRRKRDFCDSLGLSVNGLRDLKMLARQLDSSLSQAGFRHDGGSCDVNVKSWRIVRSCVVAALAPSQIVRVERPSAKYHETAEGAVQKDGVAREHRFFVRTDGTTESNETPSSPPNQSGNNNNNNNGTNRSDSYPTISIYRHYHGITEERVFLHPSSSAFHLKSYSCPWLVYHSLVRTTKAFLRDATECNSYSLLLFGGPMEVQASQGLVVMDGYVRCSAAARVGALMGGLRGRVDALLEQKIVDPGLDLGGSEEMKIIVRLLMSDGMGQ